MIVALNFQTKAIVVAVFSAFAMLGNTAHAELTIDETRVKQVVDQAEWTLQKEVDATEVLDKAIPEGKSSLLFVRKNEDDAKETSVNVSVDGRHQGSLQSGNFFQVYTCPGQIVLSVMTASNNSNDVSKNSVPFAVDENQHHFYDITVDEGGDAIINQVTKQIAMTLLADSDYQSHQISRVLQTCPTLVTEGATDGQNEAVSVVEPESVDTEQTPEPKQTQTSEQADPVQTSANNPQAQQATDTQAQARSGELKEPTSVVLRILFDNNSANIKMKYLNDIENVVALMNEYLKTKASIEGHSDNIGDDEYNQQLSQLRAEAVRYLLIFNYGISPSRLEAIGYGESRPIASNDTEEGRILNRRVEAVIKNSP